MNDCRRGTAVAAAVLSLIAVAGCYAGLAPEHGAGFATLILILILMPVALWGSRRGVNAVHLRVFEQGQLAERASDSDFV